MPSPGPPALPPHIAAMEGTDGLPVLPTWGDPHLRHVDMAETYAHLVALTAARVEFLGLLLERQYRAEAVSSAPANGEGLGGSDDGLGGLVGHTYSVAEERHGDSTSIERVAVSEELRALVKLEADERERLAKYTKDAIKLAVQASQADGLRRVGVWVSTSIRSFAGELGLDWDDAAVRRAAQRAVLAARASMDAVGGVGTDPGAAGPPLSAAERDRALGRVESAKP